MQLKIFQLMRPNTKEGDLTERFPQVYAVEANEKTASALCKCVEGARCFLTTVPPNENGSDPVVKVSLLRNER